MGSIPVGTTNTERESERVGLFSLFLVFTPQAFIKESQEFFNKLL